MNPLDNQRYCIKPGYRARNHYRPFDDTSNKDEWQREVYLYAQGMMKKHGLATAIDIGCGSGFKLIKYLEPYDTLGLEVSPTLEYLQKTYPDRRWMQSDFHDTSGLTGDLVICSDVIEHLLDPDELLNFIKTITCRYIILSTPSRNTIYWWWKKGYNGPPLNGHHIREWSFREFRAYISKHFQVTQHKITNRKQGTQMIVCVNPATPSKDRKP